MVKTILLKLPKGFKPVWEYMNNEVVNFGNGGHIVMPVSTVGARVIVIIGAKKEAKK
jgi:putative transposon-encoded protein